MKKLLLILAFCSSIFAADATMSIVNEGVNLPKIVVQDASNLANSEFGNKFFKLMVGDLKVGATFEVSDEYLQSSYDAGASDNLGSSGAARVLKRRLDEGDDFALSLHFDA